MKIHKFLYILDSPKALLGKNSLKQLKVKITFKKKEIISKDQQHVKHTKLNINN